MKTVGVIGGIGPESTVEYYRLIIASYRERIQDGSYPSIVVNSIDLTKMLDLIEANDLAKVAWAKTDPTPEIPLGIRSKRVA